MLKLLIGRAKTGKTAAIMDEIRSRLESQGEQQGLDIRIQREDIFDAMHRV